MKTVSCFLLVMAFWPSMASRAAAGAPDWPRARAETVAVLADLVRINTTSPPGNETAAAKYLQSVLAREGIASEIFEIEPGHGNLVARTKGSGKRKPLLLLGHTDVVGVEREKWTVDPFGGVIKEGFLYGRGVADDKGMTVVCLEIMLWLKRSGVALDRDVIFLAEAGEESTPEVGIDFMVRKHWDQIECEFAVNEGGVLREEKGTVRFVGISTSEKVPRPFLLSAHGTSGHGSKPVPDNAIVHLAAAVARVGQWQPPMRLNDTTREFFRRMAAVSPPDESFMYRNLEDQVLGPMIEERFRTSNVTFNSMLRTSISPNIFKGGFRANVIPGDALATLDVRILPDENVPAFAETLRRLINDPLVEVVPPEGGRPVAPPSRMDTELFLAFERAQKRHFPAATTLPMMISGATDSAQLRAKGVQAYGIGTVLSEQESARIHGNDERVSIEGLGMFLEYLWTVVTDVAAAKP